MAAALLVVSLVAAETDWQASGAQWWSHVQYLASDELAGRETGSPGYSQAAEYVARQFMAQGLEPAGTSGYFQNIDFRVKQIDEQHSNVMLFNARGGASALKLGEDVTLDVRSSPARAARYAAVFVGYGFAAPEFQFDEFAGVDLKGKIAVYIAGGPASLPAEARAHYQSAEERYRTLAAAGAVGMAVIPNPKTAEIPWARMALARLQPVMDLAIAGGGSPATAARSARGITRQNTRRAGPGILLHITINAERADKFFAGSGHSIDELLALADKGEPLPKFPLAVRVRAHVAVKTLHARAPNVIGMLPGSDPQLKNETVVVSAHLDHVGVQPAAPAAHKTRARAAATGYTTARWTTQRVSLRSLKLRAGFARRARGQSVRCFFWR